MNWGAYVSRLRVFINIHEVQTKIVKLSDILAFKFLFVYLCSYSHLYDFFTIKETLLHKYDTPVHIQVKVK